MEEPAVNYGEPGQQATTHIVHVLMQFAIAVRHRKNLVLAALVVAGLLGGLYYTTATPYYAAKATLLVRQSGATQVGTTSLQPQGGVEQGLMPTYEGLIVSARVIEGALGQLRPEDRVDLADVPRDGWAATLQKNLSAKTVYGTNMIDIEYRSKDPAAAVAVVNAIITSYLEFMDKTHKSTASEIMEVLTVQKDEVSSQLRQMEAQLQFRRNQIGYFDIRTDSRYLHPVVQRAVTFNDALIESRREQVDIKATLGALEAAVRSGDDLQQYVLSIADTVGKEMLLTVLGFSSRDAATQARLHELLVQDEALLKSLEQHLGSANPRIAETKNRISVLQQHLYGYQEQIRQRMAQIQADQLGPTLIAMMRQKLSEAFERERLLEQQYQRAHAEAGQFSGAMAEIAILEHELERNRELYDSLCARLASVDMQQQGADIRVSVVNDPVKASSPVSPNLRSVALMVLITGVAAGLAAVYVLDTLDDRFRSVEEMQTRLRVPVMAIVRQLKTQEFDGLESLQICAEPDAPESEAFRTLRTALSLAEQESQRMVVSSAEPGDGKTTVLANLAVCYAQSGKKTLLVDADLRRPGLTATLGLRGVEGLSEIIRFQSDIAQMAVALVRASGIENLDILPSGVKPTNPAELLASPRLAELLNWAGSVYDQILIDSPPALAASDTALIGRLVDGVVLVVQPAKNRRRLVLRVAESLAMLKIHLFGLVINRVGGADKDTYCGEDYGRDYDYSGDDDEDDFRDGPRRAA